MEASVFVRQPNSYEYSKLGKRKFTVLPRHDEFFSADFEGGKKYFQVLAVCHGENEGAVELYAVQAEPPWLVKKARSIGFAK
jgi:hypothetical protein